MDGFNIVSREVARVERENSLNSMDGHRRSQLRVMNLHAQNAMLKHQTLPFPVNCRRIGKMDERPLDFVDFPEYYVDRKSKAILLNRPGRHIPKFGDVLEGEIDGLPRTEQLGDAFNCGAVAGIVRLDSAKQNVGVHEATHLAAVAVDAFAANGLF